MAAEVKRKGVVWDETNLEANKKYFEENPVTMKITEPPTPYHYEDHTAPPEEAHFHESEAETGEAAAFRPTANASWDPKFTETARLAKLTAPVLSTSTEPPVETNAETGQIGGKRPRPAIKLAVAEPDPEEERKKKEAEFKHMRKAVYAEEGKLFKKQKEASEEEDE
jgi:hypothetical protein